MEEAVTFGLEPDLDRGVVVAAAFLGVGEAGVTLVEVFVAAVGLAAAAGVGLAAVEALAGVELVLAVCLAGVVLVVPGESLLASAQKLRALLRRALSVDMSTGQERGREWIFF